MFGWTTITKEQAEKIENYIRKVLRGKISEKNMDMHGWGGRIFIKARFRVDIVEQGLLFRLEKTSKRENPGQTQKGNSVSFGTGILKLF